MVAPIPRRWGHMGFSDAVKTCFNKYADFTGRAGRPEYWWFVLSYVIVYIVVAIIGSAIKASWLAWIPLLAYIIPLLAAAVRRFHDTGRSGWWYFIWLVPLVGPIIAIVFLASQGNAGSNQYGPPPGGSPTPMTGGAVPPLPPMP
jgi:uncharacterized membrane protein YhaH (DUF805 family)